MREVSSVVDSVSLVRFGTLRVIDVLLAACYWKSDLSVDVLVPFAELGC